MSIVGLILARGGSKGIKRKNLRRIGGKTLVARAVLAARGSKLRSVFVSSDSDDILREAGSYGALTIKRSPETSGDDATSEAAVAEFLTARTDGAVALIQPTTPFLRSSHIDAAIDKFEAGVVDSVVTVSRFPHYLGYPGEKDGREFIPMRPYRSLRQQPTPVLFQENGGVYIATADLWRAGRRIGETCGIVEMPFWESLEIDDPVDLEVARKIKDLMPADEAEAANVDIGAKRFIEFGPEKNRHSGRDRWDDRWYTVGLSRTAGLDLRHDFDVRPFPIAGDSFSVAFGSHILEHVKDPVEFLVEVRRLLKPGGLCRMNVPDARRLMRRYLDGKSGIDHCVDQLRSYKPYLHRTPYDTKKLKAHFEEAGFVEVVHLESGKSGSKAMWHSYFWTRRDRSIFVEGRKPR